MRHTSKSTNTCDAKGPLSLAVSWESHLEWEICGVQATSEVPCASTNNPFWSFAFVYSFLNIHSLVSTTRFHSRFRKQFFIVINFRFADLNHNNSTLCFCLFLFLLRPHLGLRWQSSHGCSQTQFLMHHHLFKRNNPKSLHARFAKKEEKDITIQPIHCSRYH